MCVWCCKSEPQHSRQLRLAIRFVSELPAAAVALIAKSWRDFKVLESPVTVKLLSSSFLRRKLPFEAKNWEAWLAPEPEKCYWWLARVTEAFSARVARANAETLGRQVTLRTRANSFRDKSGTAAEEVFQVSMAWASWQTEMHALVSDKRMTELNAMFTRGLPPQRKPYKGGAWHNSRLSSEIGCTLIDIQRCFDEQIASAVKEHSAGFKARD